MNDAALADLPESWRIPSLVRALSSFALVVLDGEDRIMDANRGFLALLDTDAADAGTPVGRFLLNPSVHVLRSARADPESGEVFRGILTIGSPDAAGRSLHGTAFRHRDRLLIVGEHDVAELVRLNDVVLALSDELAQKQRELVQANRLLQAREVELEQLAGTDPLTGIANRRRFSRRLAEELARARRSDGVLSVTLVDLDRFKDLNDTYGHAAGDDALVAVADVLRESTRASDVVARVGGEEFAVLMPGLTLAHARERAEGLRAAIAGLRPPVVPVPITASLGVAEARPSDTEDDLLRVVDDALYGAKAAGRDRVVTGSE